MDINVFLFNGFETLDAFGPVEVFGKVEGIRLRFFSFGGGEVVSAQGVTVATEASSEVEPDGVLLVPGGMATRRLVDNPEFLAELLRLVELSGLCLSVCTGSALLARSGTLDGHRATSNKRAWAWATAQSARVEWEERARWVVSGKFYTSSGVSAGIDMALGFVADHFGRDVAEQVARQIEYVWNDNPAEDRFCQSNHQS